MLDDPKTETGFKHCFVASPNVSLNNIALMSPKLF